MYHDIVKSAEENTNGLKTFAHLVQEVIHKLTTLDRGQH